MKAPLPKSCVFGDSIDWSSPLTETHLYVELPFWLMTPPGRVELQWSGFAFTAVVCPPWIEVFAGEYRDSRASCVYQGPWRPPNGYSPPAELVEKLEALQAPLMQRMCKTVLRLSARAHTDAFRTLADIEPPRVKREQQAYWASLCDAHIPVINELIQRYRLVTYDYFAYEVSAWDVPIWYLKQHGAGSRAVLLPYKSWDDKPFTVEPGTGDDEPRFRPFEWAAIDELAAATSGDATPGEFDLLDAGSLMERGDYTGAVRRTVTAIEAVVAWALLGELEKVHDRAEAESRLQKTDTDFPGRLRQWRKLAGSPISEQEIEAFETTRDIRHAIVHRGLRLVHNDRGRAQKAVDLGRWLYNKIEAKPARATLRDKGVLKSAGRLEPRFPATVSVDGIIIGQHSPRTS